MTMKGHNYDGGKGILCKLCGKIHIAGATGRHDSRNSMLGHNFDHGKGDICQKCGKIHKVKTLGGHNFDQGIGIPCKKCGKVHHMPQNKKKGWVGSLRGHTFDHGKGIPCVKCGKIHTRPETWSANRRKLWTFRQFWRIIEEDDYQSHEKEHRSAGGKKSTKTKLKKYGCIYKPSTKEQFGHRPELSKKLRAIRLHQVFPKKNSDIEIILQTKLKELKISFQTNVPIDGQPDIFIEPNICIFADGCYHHGCKIHLRGNYFKGQSVEQKRISDAKITLILQSQGYIVLRFWGHDIKHNLDFCINQILQEVKKCQYQKTVS